MMSEKSGYQYYGSPLDTINFCREIYCEFKLHAELRYRHWSSGSNVCLTPDASWPDLSASFLDIDFVTFYAQHPLDDSNSLFASGQEKSSVERMVFRIGELTHTSLLESQLGAWGVTDNVKKRWRAILRKFKKSTSAGVWYLNPETKLYEYYPRIRYFADVACLAGAERIQLKQFEESTTLCFIDEPVHLGILFER